MDEAYDNHYYVSVKASETVLDVVQTAEHNVRLSDDEADKRLKMSAGDRVKI